MRRILQSFVIALVAFSATSAFATGLVATRSIGAAPVVKIHATDVADLVVLGAGFEAGLRQGMVCQISRQGTVIGEVVLVELRPTASAALILELASDQSIRSGDIATVKILKS